MSRQKLPARPLRHARLSRLECIHLSRSLCFEQLEDRRLLSVAQTETNSQGTVYTLTDPASGGWLEMKVAGSDATVVIDTNVARFALDDSGAAVAEENTGNLALFPANSSSREQMLSDVRNFVIDANHVVTALQVAAGSQWGTLYRFVPGSANAEEYTGEEFSDLVAALGYAVALGADGTLRYFPDNSLDARELVNGGDVTNFVVDGDGSVVALVKSSQGATAGNLVRWSADGEPPTTIDGSYQALALDGKGDVVALDNADPAQHLGVVWFFARGSNTRQQMSPNWQGPSGSSPYPGTFLVDGSGTVWVFEQLPGHSIIDWYASTYYPGSNTQKALTLTSNTSGVYKQFELDGAGSVVAVNDSNSLVRFAPGGTMEQEMAPAVSDFVVDGAGFVVAHLVAGGLVQFAPGATSGLTISDGDVTTIAVDATGAVIALNTAGSLDSFSPGSTTGTQLDSIALAFELDKNGQVVALEHSGNLILFYPASSSTAYDHTVLIQHTYSSTSPGWGVESFHIDPNGYVVAVEVYVSSSGSLMNVAAPFAIAYILPATGQTPRYVTFQFAVQNFNNHTVTAVATQSVSSVFLLGDGSMLVTILDTYTQRYDYPTNLELPPQRPSEYFIIPPGLYSNVVAQQSPNYSLTGFWVAGVNVTIDDGSTPWVETEPTVATEYATGYTVIPIQEQPPSPIATFFEDVGLFAIGIGLSLLGGELLAPAIADGLEGLGLGASAAVPTSEVVAGVVANAVDQGIDTKLRGGSFNWLEALTAGALDWGGDELLNDAGDTSLAAHVTVDTVSEEVTTLVKDLQPSESEDPNAADAAEAANEFVGNVANDLQTSAVSSTFLNDSTSFLANAPAVADDLQFLNPALSFLKGAVGGNWNDPAFASFAQSGASLLEQIESDGLGGSAFSGVASLFLYHVTAAGLTGTAFAQDTLSFLEDSLASQQTDSGLVASLGTFLDEMGPANLEAFANSSLGAGI